MLLVLVLVLVWYWYWKNIYIGGTGTGTGEENIYTGGIKEQKDVNVDEHEEEFHADMHGMSEYS